LEKFKTIKSLYDHIEVNALDCDDLNLADLFKNLRDIMVEEKQLDEAHIAQFEIDIFCFTLKNGKIFPLYIMNDKNGDIIEYPRVDNLTDKFCEYLVSRFDSTSNPKLKSRYGQILWFSPKKNGKYAQIAIECYLELIKLYEEKDLLNPQEHYGAEVLGSIKNAYYLSRNMNDGHLIKVTKSKIKSLIFHFNPRSVSSFRLKVDLIELMLEERRIFRKDDFIAIQHICIQMAENKNNSENLRAAIYLFELGEKIDQKLGANTCNWRLLIAESYERWMGQTEKNALIATDFCQKALENYRSIKNKDKIEELEKKYIQLKSSIKLELIEYKCDLNEILDDFRLLAKRIAKHNPEEIIGYLMYNKELLPTYKYVESLAEDIIQKYPITNLFPEIILDQNTHPAQHFYEEGEKKYYKILCNYKLGLELIYIRKINIIIFEAILAGKINAKTFIDFLHTYSWFSNTVIKNLPNGQKMEYNWLSLIAPAIIEYFNQIEYYSASGRYPNLILPIDSLTLKIEGLIRYLCEELGVVTFTQSKDKTIREKDINALLHEQKMTVLLDEDDLILLKFLLVEKAGYNLRHNIAHALATYEEYNINYMNLLLLALLRLGKYMSPST